MRLFVPAVAALTLSAASLAAIASVTEADMFGKPAQASAAQRTISIDPKTRWITVERGEVVKFVANGQEFHDLAALHRDPGRTRKTFR